MRKLWKIVLTACLLCHLAKIHVCPHQTSLNWEEDFGVDMCPECRPVPQVVHTLTPEKLHEEDLGIDMCPECRSLPQNVGVVKPENFHEEDLGVDMCPECRPSPQQVPTVKPEDFHVEDLGVDMCPECRLLPQEFHAFAPEQSHEKDLEVDMCPEKGQPISARGSHPGRILATDSNTLVQELQQLVKAQQLQIDQLGHLLQQLRKVFTIVDPEFLDLPKEQIPNSRESNVRIAGDVSSEDHHKEAAVHEHLRKKRELQKSIGIIIDENSPTTQGVTDVLPSDGEGHESGGGMIVAPYRPSWSEHFSFLSAVKVDGEVSSLHVLPQEGDDEGARYVVGDVNGKLHIFLWSGELLLHHPTISRAPVTAMLSYTLQKTETILVTGHADGAVLMHQIHEPSKKQYFSKEDRSKLSFIKALQSLIPPSPQSVRASIKEKNNGDDGTGVSMYGRDASVSVVNLETFKVGRMRYTIVVDKSGKIQLFRDNGSLHGVAQSPSQPLAFVRNPNAQRLAFLTEKGVATLDLRSMQVRNSLCVDLNSSTVMTYAFDAVGRSRANGFTTEGDMVSVLLRGDMIHFECHVKKKRRLELPGPFAALALKGYLVAATRDYILLFNTTHTGFSNANFWAEGPRLIFSVTMKEIALSFLKTPTSQSPWPVMASNRDRFIVVGFSGGYVGVFRSNLPIKPAEFAAKFWNSSILISGLVLLAMWQLFNRRRDHVQSSSSPTYDNAESARLSFGEREKVVEPRRFKSPTRGYVDGNKVPFGSSSRSFVPSGVDTGTYSAMREPLFASNQPVGELEPSLHDEGDILNSTAR